MILVDACRHSDDVRVCVTGDRYIRVCPQVRVSDIRGFEFPIRVTACAEVVPPM